jgi:hypothetical protein
LCNTLLSTPGIQVHALENDKGKEKVRLKDCKQIAVKPPFPSARTKKSRRDGSVKKLF